MVVLALGAAMSVEAQRRRPWRVGIIVGPPHPWIDAAEHFKRVVEEGTGGAVQVQIFDKGQLGNETLVIQSMRDGTVDLFIGGAGTISTFVPEIGFVNLPGLFLNQDHFERALDPDGPLVKEMAEAIERRGLNLKSLSLTGGGVRHVSTRAKEVRHANDLRGLRMRVPNSRVAIAFWEALGTLPVSMAFSEVYTSLQTGVVDGFESTVPAYVQGKLYEVAPVHIRTEHEFMVSAFLMRKDLYDSLSPEWKELVDRAGREAGEVAMRAGVEQTEQLLAELEALGATIISDVDKESFTAASGPIQEELARELGITHWLDAVRAAR